MKRKLFYNVGVGALSILMAATQITPAFAGSWVNGKSGWNYIKDDGSKASGWTQTPSGWYYFDADSGVMKTGWQQDEKGNWTFLSTAEGAAQGQLLTGWNWIDGYCYYFNNESGPDRGKMVANGKTPDGFQVNADGRWEKDGKVVFEQGKGLPSVVGAANNKAQADKAAKKSSKGSSGGGSSSRGGGSSRSRRDTTVNNNVSSEVAKDNKVNSEVTTENKAVLPQNVENNANTAVNNSTNTENSVNNTSKAEDKVNNKVDTTADTQKSVDKIENKAQNNSDEIINNAGSKTDEAANNADKKADEAANNADTKVNDSVNNADSKANDTANNEDKTENNGTANTEKPEETNNDKFAYVKYTKNVNTDFGEYVVVAFKYGTIDNYKVLVDGVDVTADMTKVDDEGHVVKWLSSVSRPSALQIVNKADNDTQDITLAGGERKTITKTSIKAPKYVISNGPITKFDYFLETYDNEGKIRKNASKTTFTLQTKKTDSATAAVPSKYYIPVTEIDSVGNGSIKIKLQLENVEQETWFGGLNNIKLLNEEHNIVNSNLVYTTDTETKYGKVGVINIPLPQNNARSRGDYYVSIGSSKGNERISLPISLVSSTNFKVMRDSTTPNPKIGGDIRFRIVDTKTNQSFGNDVGVVMYRVTLTKPDGTTIDLPKYSGWHNIADIVQITGTDSTSGKVYTDVAGVYTATIYTKGYKTLTKKFEVLKNDGTSAATNPVKDESKTIDAISSPTVSKTHSGNRDSYKGGSTVLVGYGTGGSGKSSGKKADSVSSATGKSGRSSDATSGASGSMMINSYLLYEYDLLTNAMVLNEIGLRTKASDAVMNWWLEQSPEAIVGDDKGKIYRLNDFVDAYNDARLEGNVLTFEDYIKSEDARTRESIGNIKNVLENGKLGTIYRYGNLIGEAAPTFEGLTQPKGESYTITTDNVDFLKNLYSIVMDGSSPLRGDNYLKQYEVNLENKSITIYNSAFNRYLAPIVGKHKLVFDSTGFEKVEIELTITDTLEEVELTDVSEKHETGSSIIINAVKDGDAKKGDFLSKLGSVKIQNPDGTLRDVISAAAGGMDSDSVYKVADGKVELRGGLFKTAGEYTIFLQSSDRNYPVKSIKVTLTQKEEAVPPVTPGVTEDAEAPNAKTGGKSSTFFYEMLTVKFDGMDAADLEKYLKAVNEVSVNGEEFTKTSSFGFGDNAEFKAHSNATYGGKISELSVKGKKGKFNAAKYDFVVKAEGYKDLTFTLNADGSIAEATAPTTPSVPTPAAKVVEIEKVEATRVNYSDAYVITLKGDADKIAEFTEKLSAVEVNGVSVGKLNRISSLSGDGFTVTDDKVYVKSNKFKGLSDNIVLKAEGYDDVSYTTESQIPTPAVTSSEAVKAFFDRYVRVTFDDSDRTVLKTFMKEIKAGNVTVTVNGITYNKGFNISANTTYKVSSNMTYGYDQYIDLSLDGFNQGSNEVVISSDNFETIRVDVEVNTSSSSGRRNRRDLSALSIATSSNASR